MSEQYRIDNFSNPAPFTVIVEYDPVLVMYSVRVNLHGKWYTRDIGEDRLRAIIIAKDVARSLEDAFRLMYEDHS